MSATLTVDEAQARLKELIHQLAPGDEIIITENQQPVAKLVSGTDRLKSGLRPPPGLGKGYISVLSEDDDHLSDFEDYMP
ncbi:MAG TPA: type II toxin-antitoxin system prevent-host-death family antitoxin [Isosphaeraceae bacterium]|nr:type II toxin-antitoxin system prevent-host-death family antitoxin [Isosphaeraceae bacterium]